MVNDAQRLRKGLTDLFKKIEGSKTTTWSKEANFLSRRNKTPLNSKKPPVWMEKLSDDQFVEKNRKKTKNQFKFEQGKGPLIKEETSSINSNGQTSGKKSSKERHWNNSTKLPKKHHFESDNEMNNNKIKKNQKGKNKGKTDEQLMPKTLKKKKSEEYILNGDEEINDEIKQATKKRKRTNKVKNNTQESPLIPNLKMNMIRKRASTLKVEKPKRKKIKKSQEKDTQEDMKIFQTVNLSFDSDGKYKPFGNNSFLESDYNSCMDDSCSGSSFDDYDVDDCYSEEYSLSSSEQYSSDCIYNYSELEEDKECSDPDYELPPHEVEDLIVHKGLAVTYDLERGHGIVFDETFEDSYIIELPNQKTAKTIKQYEAYNIEKLRSLEYKYHEENLKSVDDCPKLVPIEYLDEDDKGFKLWTSGVTMDDELFSDYELVEDSDECSTLSYNDVNRKYLQPGLDVASDRGINKETSKEHFLKAFVIDASKENIQQLMRSNEDHYMNSFKHEPELSEIIHKTSESLCASNITITKAVIKNYDNENNDFEYGDGFAYNLNRKTAFRTEGRAFMEDQNSREITNIEPNSMDIDLTAGIYKNIEDSDDLKILFHHTGTNDATIKKKTKFLTKFCNSIDSYHVLVLLKTPFYLYGSITAKLIAGAMEIYGYDLKIDETVTIYSPRGCSAVPLQPTSLSSSSTLPTEAEIIARIEAFNDVAEFNLNDISELLSTYDSKNDAILLLNRNETAIKIKQILQQHINENVFPAHIPLSRPLSQSEVMLDCMVNVTTEYALQIPTQWLNINLKENSKLMVVGGKAVGKSTCLRYLLNKHLAEFSNVLLIDLDIGQPEIFVPQTISCTLLQKPLLGPGFFGQYQPDKALAVGHTNLISCAHAYMRAVICLLEYCNNNPAYQNILWLVNTMGYNKGFGSELIAVICSHLHPTDIIQLESNKPINNFDVLFHPAVIANMPRVIYDSSAYDSSNKYIPNHQLHIIPSPILQESRYQREWQMSAKDMRYVMLLAHLSSILPDDSEWINLSKTFGHNLQQLKVVNLIDRTASEKETLKSLECNLVYLCYVVNKSRSVTVDGADSQDNDAPIECLGLGLVRGIDYLDKKIFIIPAMKAETLPFVNCLALGEMPLPASLLIVQNPKMMYNVPFVQVMNDEATSRAVKQFFYRK